jgi:predicted RNase H-like nuclease (RuvC/YqgF family)
MQNFTNSFEDIHETKYDYDSIYNLKVDFPLTFENFLDKNIEFRFNGFQILIISTVFFLITICFPLRRNISRILELEESNANQKEIIENYQNKVKEIDSEAEELNDKVTNLENENAFLVSRLKKLEEKNQILVNSLEEFITKKYITHPYNLRKKEKVDYTNQVDNSVVKEEDSDSDYNE